MWVFGAGISYDLAPLPIDLVKEQLEPAEKDLDIDHINNIPEDTNGLYIWAEQALEKLKIQDNPIPSKLRLAKSLGILSDERWFKKLDLCATSAKHRVIARLAMDGKLDEIWSLNWDCHLENAMESIGFQKSQERDGLPWANAYNIIVTNDDFERARLKNRFLKIYKPHGCVRALQEAEVALTDGQIEIAQNKSERFMITSAELNTRRENDLDNRFDTEAKASIQAKHLVSVGWSMSEGNWAKILQDSVGHRGGTANLGDLSIIDPNFSSGHEQASLVFETSKENVHFQISINANEVDTNCFFLWLQTHYCIDQMVLAITPFDDHNTETALSDISEEIDDIQVDHFLYKWADSFLPSWVRLCWRGETIFGTVVTTDHLDHHNRYEHIPLNLHSIKRPDLFYAAKILTTITENFSKWDMERFPGSFFAQESGELIIPIPHWCETFKSLSALKPMLGFYEYMGLVSKIKLLPICSEGTHLNAQEIELIKQSFSQIITMPQYANPNNLEISSELMEQMGVTHD